MQEVYEDTANHWLDVVNTVIDNGYDNTSRAGNTRNLFDYHAKFLNPRQRYINPINRNFNLPFAIVDFVDIVIGNNPGNGPMFNSKMSQFMNEENKFDGSYGDRFNVPHKQLVRVVDELKKHPDSRRAVIQVFNPVYENFEGSDVCCTLSLQFLKVGKFLNMITTMRSEDLYLGFCYDTFIFQMLQECVAAILQLEVGEYSHNVGCIHVYEKDFDNIRKIKFYPRKWHVVPIKFVTFTEFFQDIHQLNDLIQQCVDGIWPIAHSFNSEYFEDCARLITADIARRNKRYGVMNDIVSYLVNDDFKDYFHQKLSKIETNV